MDKIWTPVAPPQGVTMEMENRDPQKVEWESESREPPGTALKHRNVSSSSSDSEAEAPVKPKLRRKKKWVKSRPQFEWCDERCCDSSCGEYTYSDECGCESDLSSRPRVCYCVLKCCSSSEDWSSCECKTPSPSKPHYSYCRAVCFTSASESEEDVTDGCVLTIPAKKTAAEDQDKSVEEPSMGTRPRESEEAVVEPKGKERVPPNHRNVSSASDSETEAPVKPKPRRKKRVNKKHHLDKGVDECGSLSFMSNRSQESLCVKQHCWLCKDRETPLPASPTDDYLRDVSVTSAAEGGEECMDSGLVTTAMPEELNVNEEIPKMARTIENMHLGDVSISCITCVCTENDQ